MPADDLKQEGDMPYHNIFRKIVFAADFSTASLKAFAYALNIATGNPGCELVILHVVPEPDAQFWKTYIYEVDKIDEKAKADIDEKVRQTYLSRIPQSIPYSIKMAVGNVANAILETARTENAGLVILGREGSSVLQSHFLGNITEKIARKAPCPVMIIPKEQAAEET
jgi:nucleotide-binding universal stress UspA family protein